MRQSRGLARQVSSKHLNGFEVGHVTWVAHEESAHRPEGHKWKPWVHTNEMLLSTAHS